jgi:hypothetical protein
MMILRDSENASADRMRVASDSRLPPKREPTIRFIICLREGIISKRGVGREGYRHAKGEILIAAFYITYP